VVSGGRSPTRAPRVEEQDELDPPGPAQGQGVAADGRVGRGAHGQRQRGAGGAGDGGAPAGGVHGGRQAERGPGAVLLRGLRACRGREDASQAETRGQRSNASGIQSGGVSLSEAEL